MLWDQGKAEALSECNPRVSNQIATWAISNIGAISQETGVHSKARSERIRHISANGSRETGIKPKTGLMLARPTTHGSGHPSCPLNSRRIN